MTDTELKLLELHKAPIVPLKDICEQYFGVSYKTARLKAARNELPVATWRLVDSRKAPYVVRLTELAAHIDRTSQGAQASWDNSQVT